MCLFCIRVRSNFYFEVMVTCVRVACFAVTNLRIAVRCKFNFLASKCDWPTLRSKCSARCRCKERIGPELATTTERQILGGFSPCLKNLNSMCYRFTYLKTFSTSSFKHSSSVLFRIYMNTLTSVNHRRFFTLSRARRAIKSVRVANQVTNANGVDR